MYSYFLSELKQLPMSTEMEIHGALCIHHLPFPEVHRPFQHVDPGSFFEHVKFSLVIQIKVSIPSTCMWCMYMCVYVCMHMFKHVHRGQRSTLCAFLDCSPSWFLTDLEHTDLARLAIEFQISICLYPKNSGSLLQASGKCYKNCYGPQ